MSQQRLTTQGFLEALQDYLDAATDLSYTKSGRYANLFIDSAVDVDERSKRETLTLIEEPGELEQGGRHALQNRVVRFVTRSPGGSHDAKNDAHALLRWLEDHRWIQQGGFTIRWLRLETTPTITFVADSGIATAEMVIVYLVTYK